MSSNKQNQDLWGRLQPCLPTLTRIDLFASIVTFGTSQICDVVLPAMPSTSREHFCLIKEKNCRIFLIDFSKNGTYLNTLPVAHTKKTMIHSGDVIAIGNSLLQIYIFKLIPNFTETNELPSILGIQYFPGMIIKKTNTKETRLAYHKVTGKTYMIKKIVKPRILNNDKHFRILEKLSHPCILAIEEIVIVEYEIYFLCEYMRNGNILNYIKAGMEESHSKIVFYQMVLAVQYLPRCGIIHGGLKPENIFLVNNNPPTIKVGGFGLNQICQERVFAENYLNKYFTAPEVLDAHNISFDEKIDVWSLGEILFYFLFKTLPFKGLDRQIKNIMFIKSPFNIEDDFSISYNAKDLLLKMLDVNPENRIGIDAIITHHWILEDENFKNGLHHLFESEETNDFSELKRIKLSHDNY